MSRSAGSTTYRNRDDAWERDRDRIRDRDQGRDGNKDKAREQHKQRDQFYRESRGRSRSRSRSPGRLRSYGDSGDRGNRDRNQRRRDRSRSRSHSKERFRGREHSDLRAGSHLGGGERTAAGIYGEGRASGSTLGSSRGGAPTISVDPSSTVMIKGLAGHITEPTLYHVIAPYQPKDLRVIFQRDGECKGFAFVEFADVEHAKYFMASFAGSAGDSKAPQLIVDNRAVMLEYATSRVGSDSSHSNTSGNRGSGSSGHAHGGRPIKSDWLCQACSCHNFAKRNICFRCSAERTDSCQSVELDEAYPDTMISSDNASLFLAIRGFHPMTTEEQLRDLFRQYAVVKSVKLVAVDDGTGTNRSTSAGRGSSSTSTLAYVEFHSVEHAQYVLKNTNNMHLPSSEDASSSGRGGSGITLRVSFARESIMDQLLNKGPLSAAAAAAPAYGYTAGGGEVFRSSKGAGDRGGAAGVGGGAMPHNPMLVAAMNAAQWSANNTYGSTDSQIPASTSIPAAMMHPNTGGLASRKAHRWPPHFETQGGSYVFQAKTGCFYDSSSDYYYDPKAKLYYSASDGLYYRYQLQPPQPGSGRPATESPFVRFEPPLPQESFTAATSTTAGSGSSANPPLGAAAVATSAALNASSASSAIPAPTKVTLGFGRLGSTQKKQKVKNDIAKWGALQQLEEDEAAVAVVGEKNGKKEEESGRARSGSTSSSAGFQPVNTTTSSSSSSSSASVSAGAAASLPVAVPVAVNVAPNTALAPVAAAAAAAAAGKAICYLCERQFASIDMLRRHEQESKLHAENLRKKAVNI